MLCKIYIYCVILIEYDCVFAFFALIEYVSCAAHHPPRGSETSHEVLGNGKEILNLINSFKIFCNFFFIWQSLAPNMLGANSYNSNQYLFIKGEFWQIHHYITLSSHILHTFKKSNINSFIINKCLNFNFCDIRLCIKNKLIYQITNNIWLTWNLTCILRPKWINMLMSS